MEEKKRLQMPQGVGVEPMGPVRASSREQQKYLQFDHAMRTYRQSFDHLVGHAAAGMRFSYGPQCYPDQTLARRLASAFVTVVGFEEKTLLSEIEALVADKIEEKLRTSSIPTTFQPPLPSQDCHADKNLIWLSRWMLGAHVQHKEHRDRTS